MISHVKSSKILSMFEQGILFKFRWSPVFFLVSPLMYLEKSVAVVIPAYNEENLIGQTVQTIPDFVDKIIVVNDASTDSTSAIVQEIATRRKRSS